ncbi:hypothetical protein JTE90_002783 [Oedothorax gibbosus]|uniref:Uncharacterized protein n=1 Tax=Oedothorax gibbosus TaxID=931172 RepID=A0AAV6UHC4_9ARAC|nr:hypothetical protein JTE90_002783 [Oedothorax gibbosus]
MPTTGFSDRELIDFNNCEETHSTCSSQDDRTSVIYQQKKWSVEEGSNRNYIRALTNRNAEMQTNDIQQPDMPLWNIHYDNVNYIMSFMSPLVVGNALLVL